MTCKLHHLCRNAIEDEQPQKIKQHLFFLSFYLLVHHGIFIFISGFHVWFLDYVRNPFSIQIHFWPHSCFQTVAKLTVKGLLDNIATHIARVCEVAVCLFWSFQGKSPWVRCALSLEEESWQWPLLPVRRRGFSRSQRSTVCDSQRRSQTERQGQTSSSSSWWRCKERMRDDVNITDFSIQNMVGANS